MKVPKPRRLASGMWFIQLRLGGESIPVTEASEKQCVKAAQLIKAEFLAGRRAEKQIQGDATLREVIDDYIDSRDNSLSPSTIRGYCAIRDTRFMKFMDKPIREISDWQTICNEEAKLCSAKTLKNAWGFIGSALRYSNASVPQITLPQVVIKERPYLDPDQIPVFVRAVLSEPCAAAAILALHSLRRSEVYALDYKDVDLTAGRIRVAGAVVLDKDFKTVDKETNKNISSRRYVPI